MRSQWRFVLFSYKLSITSVLFGYMISKTVSFVSLRDFSDTWFCFFVLLRDFKDSWFCFVMRFKWWLVLFGYEISVTVGFQCQSVLFCCEISKMVRFVSLFFLRDFKDGRFYSVTRFQWWLLLFSYEISVTSVLFWYEKSKTVGFVLLQDFNDGRFCSVTRFQ